MSAKSDHPLYGTWTAIKRRCNNPRSEAYQWYGAKGVRLCERWNDFWAFAQDMGPKPSPKHSIDRYPDPAGNYEPSNCRWATIMEQRYNTRPESKRRPGLTAFGRTQILEDWAREFGIPRETLASRIYQGGRPLEEALTTKPKMGPQRPHRAVGVKPLQAFGKSQHLPLWAEEYGLNLGTLNSRLRRGWTLERALTEPIKQAEPA